MSEKLIAGLKGLEFSHYWTDCAGKQRHAWVDDLTRQEIIAAFAPIEEQAAEIKRLRAQLSPLTVFKPL